jgi:hypothetical protein
MKAAASKPVFVPVGHIQTRLENSKIPVAITASDTSTRKMGLILGLLAAVFDGSGSSIERRTVSPLHGIVPVLRYA